MEKISGGGKKSGVGGKTSFGDENCQWDMKKVCNEDEKVV